ncbi:hypothetical protein [Sporosarcina pasteurii]|uniref:Uncharacterized protein n=1 Tax=Sporosarcina pasteurii TaxID=1474 RepID=A0A380CDP8_SPOPA|nr:hypothetical protein [Sporosarcina pasteurii]MDS9473212.1 hypothetical protein [Sporosarcina pasteurii]QBQ06945.1 hypothetical protein E2C16_15475 [Sporosarcina pasteurii]SUJ18407.1 Uncharacterised protein [Sporosarcina pasteurii]
MDATFIKTGLEHQGYPVYEDDIPYIADMLNLIHQQEALLENFPYVNFEVPITVFDKGVIGWQN